MLQKKHRMIHTIFIKCVHYQTLVTISGAALGISTDGFETSRNFQQNFTEFRINFLKAQQQLI